MELLPFSHTLKLEIVMAREYGVSLDQIGIREAVLWSLDRIKAAHGDRQASLELRKANRRFARKGHPLVYPAYKEAGCPSFLR